MKIGYACTPVTIKASNSRRFILKNFNKKNFYKVTKENIDDLYKILNYNIKNNIHMFRISSDIIPFGSHSINDIDWWNLFKDELNLCEKYAKENNIRLSMHPGQYTVLNSPSENIVLNSIRDIEYHTKFLDSLNLDYTNKIILHVGGVYGDKKSAMKRFQDNFKRLSDSAKKRLTIENDERNYNIEEVLYIANNINIPVIFDNLHYHLNKETVKLERIEKILENVKSTWSSNDGNMKLHYSDQSTNKKLGAHSNFVYTKNFLDYYNKIKKFNPDIMIEVKDKEISAIKCIHCTNKNIDFKKDHNFLCREWSKYKYILMEKNYKSYKECSKIVNSNLENKRINFYKFIDSCMLKPLDEKNYKNTLLHVYGYIKNKATENEKVNFFKLYETNDTKKAKKYLHRLCKKYNIVYLLKSYYFLKQYN